MNKSRLIALISALFLVAVVVLSIQVSGNSKEASTFSRDVAPIFYKNCVSCHRPGEIAPMSLMSYKEVRPWAKAIREKVVSKQMPPWHPDPQYGNWENDRRLSQKEVDTIVAWVDGGAQEGNPKDLPPAPKLASGWQIGEPDMIFQMPAEFSVPAEGSVSYQHFAVPTNFKEDRYIQALEARAGNLSVVHHIVIYVREPVSLPQRGGRNQQKFNIGDGILGAPFAGNDAVHCETRRGEAHQGRLSVDLSDALHSERQRGEGSVDCGVDFRKRPGRKSHHHQSCVRYKVCHSARCDELRDKSRVRV